MKVTALFLLIMGIILLIGIIAIIVAIASSSKKEVLTTDGEDSYFDGNTFQLIGYRILCSVISVITLGIAYPWMLCLLQEWETKHTVINGRRLKFNGQGHQLIGKYILWAFLSFITFGIYGIWFGLGMKKWVVKHTVYSDEQTPVESYFCGGVGGYFVTHLLAFLLTFVTFGIGTAWANKMVISWEAVHTHIGGSPLQFKGTSGQLFVKYLVLGILSPITLGIYALFFPVIFKKWEIKNTQAVYQSKEIKNKARAKESDAIQDYAKYRLCASEQEIATVKSGFTGSEDIETLEEMSKSGNFFASYKLAKVIKGDNLIYSGRNFELLIHAVDNNYHPALLDYAKQLPPAQYVEMMSRAAINGSAEASWILAQHYMSINDLINASYWYKVAIEWGYSNAINSIDKYEELIKNIQLQLAENRPAPKANVGLAVLLGIIGVLLIGIFGMFYGLIPLNMAGQESIPESNLTLGVETVNADEIEGKKYSKNDSIGNHIEYVIDEYVFFDRTIKSIYINFGVIDSEYPVTLSFDNGVKTHPISKGTGVTRVGYPFDTAPSYVEIRTETGEINSPLVNRHNLKVTEGYFEDAQEWLKNKSGKTESVVSAPEVTSSAPTTPKTNSALVGKWEIREFYTNIETGENGFEYYDITLNSDGTYSKGDGNFLETDRETDEYINGSYWEQVGGSGISGTYTVNGNTITFTPSDGWAVQYGPEALAPKTYTYQINGDTLKIEGGELQRTREYTKAK